MTVRRVSMPDRLNDVGDQPLRQPAQIGLGGEDVSHLLLHQDCRGYCGL